MAGVSDPGAVLEHIGPGAVRKIEVFIEGTVDTAMAEGRFDRTMRSHLGVGRRPLGA